ncbi:MAG: hypothetical protein Fur0012_04100 [Elusimicrobiota bacterium]
MSKIPQIKTFQDLPVVTADKMKYLDRIATLEYGIKEETLMENAGKALSDETLAYIQKNPGALKIALFCGRGNNGGDGLVCARYLKAAGANVKIFVVAPGEKGYGKLVVENMNRAREAGVPVFLSEPENLIEIEKEAGSYDIFIDALLGISAMGKPAGVVKRLIQIMNKAGKPIIAADIPSGLSPDTGHHSGVFVTAALTVTFGFAKTGLMAPHAQKNIGILKVAPIGYPAELIEKAKN